MMQSLPVFEIEEGELTNDTVRLLDSAETHQPQSWTSRFTQRLRLLLPGNNNSSINPFQRLPQDESITSSTFSNSSSNAPFSPVQFTRPPGRWCPEEESSWFSQMTFTYASGLLRMGYSKALVQDDLWDVGQGDSAAFVSEAFQWQLEATGKKVWKAMWRAHKGPFIKAGIVKLVHDIVMFAGPFILEILLKHVQTGGSAWVGFGLATALAAAAMIETLTVNYYFHILMRMCMHLKIALVDTLYRKSLRVSSAAASDLGIGSIVNLQSNDAAKLWTLPQYLHMIWSGPFQILAVMGLLVRIIGLIPAMTGLGVTIILIPLSTIVAKKMAKVRKRVVALTDARVKLSSEVITGIKAIKLYAWEEPYAERITEIRIQELKEIQTASLIGIYNNMLWIGGPILISMAAFFAYSLLGYPLTASVAFPALSLFNLLRFPVMMFPQQLTNLVNGKVALDRIQKFLGADEMEHPPLKPASAPAIKVENGSFSWGPEGETLLKDVDLEVPPGKLVVAIGSVGSGKSSLLSAILHEMHAVSGKVTVCGTTAFTQQDPWIQNASLKENILLGAPMNRERYEAVLNACALRPDIALLPAGDETEIGEKGINLSGGQRHRAQLARACYADADIYLLDDPLSAVDAHVGRHLFDQCINGLLSRKTRILVTHQLHYLPAADEILILDKGCIVDRGTYYELSSKGVDFHQFEIESNDHSSDSGSDAADDDEQVLEKQGLNGTDKAAVESSSSHDAPLVTIDLNGATPSTTTTSDGPDAEMNDMNDVCVSVETGLIAPKPGILASPSSKVEGNLLEQNSHNQHQKKSSSSRRQSEDDGRRKSSESRRRASSEQHQILVNGSSSTSIDLSNASAEKKGDNTVLLAKSQSDGRITKAEERAVGQVNRMVYWRYFDAWGRKLIIPGIVLTLCVTERGLQAGQNWWLATWSSATSRSQTIPEDDGSPPPAVDTWFYMGVYFALGMVSLCFQITKAVTLVLGSINAARRLQANLLATVLRLPMSFFDSQPTGRLLNRFTKDTEAVDTSLSQSVSSFLNCSVSVLWSLIVVVIVSPGVSLAIVPLGFAYSYIQARYVATSRELKRLDSLALSPIFGHFSETLQGLITLRAFRVQNRVTERNSVLLDESNRAYWPAQCVNRWLSVRLETLGITVVFGTAVFVSSLLPTSAGLAGLALTSALNLTGLMNWMVRQTTELEVNMNSVERLIEYDTVEQEAPAIVYENRPLPEWPQHGAIQVENLVVRYRPELDPVLHGISFDVKPKEKIGVAGRTGCGKSTLMMALYRIVEPYSGRIVIDSIDTSTIGLFDLRSRLALVPQDPVVFSGTIRSNLDPFGTTGGRDEALWQVLRQAGLEPAVRAMPMGLDAIISESGGNLSTGQRQLLCMARALLRKARILVLDEATSNVDTTTDGLIQAAIATAFADCTVLTIAHRLHTIMDSDRVLVLSAGRVSEYDSPTELLKKPQGAFKALVDETARRTGS